MPGPGFQDFKKIAVPVEVALEGGRNCPSRRTRQIFTLEVGILNCRKVWGGRTWFPVGISRYNLTGPVDDHEPAIRFQALGQIDTLIGRPRFIDRSDPQAFSLRSWGVRVF